MVDCQLFGLKPGPQHLVSVILHAVNAMLLFVLLRNGTGATWRSFSVAMLFAVHPLNVETVAWVAERKSVLCTLFAFLAIAAYGLYSSRPDLKNYLLVCFVFSLALMSKPMAVSLPLVLLLVDFWPLNRLQNLPARTRWARLSVEKIPLLLMSAASCVATIAAQRAWGAVSLESIVPFPFRLENATVSYMLYIRKVAWPAGLAIFYPLPEHYFPWLEVAGSALILLLITVGVVSFRRYGYLLVGWLLFVVTLFPVIGIIQVGSQAMADRYAYIPCIGIFIIASWGLNDLLGRMASKLPVIGGTCTTMALVLIYASTSCNYLRYWQDGTKLFTRAGVVAQKPNAMIERLLGDSLDYVGRDDEAFEHYRNACMLQATDPLCRFNMGRILLLHNQFRDAAEQFDIGAAYANSQEMKLNCLTNSAEALLSLGDNDGARIRLAAALGLDSTNRTALRLLQRQTDQGHQ
jgi:hypothetical protein